MVPCLQWCVLYNHLFRTGINDNILFERPNSVSKPYTGRLAVVNVVGLVRPTSIDRNRKALDKYKWHGIMIITAVVRTR